MIQARLQPVALDIAKNGWIQPKNDWILNLWPPGFMLLEAAVVAVFGVQTPAVLILQVLASLLLAIALFLQYQFIKTLLNEKLAVILPLMILAFPVTRVFLLQPSGVVQGETFSISFFFIFLMLALRSMMNGSLGTAVYAGVCLALSAYFRSQFEIILLIFSLWAVLMLVILRFSSLKRRVSPRLTKALFNTLLFILLVAHAVMLPWRGYHDKYQGGWFWVATSTHTFQNSVKTTAYFQSVGAGFVSEGGGNLVCRIDPSTCGDIANAKSHFIKTFLLNPVQWYSIKAKIIGKYWSSSLQNWVAIGAPSTWVDIAVNGVLLLFIVLIQFSLFTRRVANYPGWLLLLWFDLSIISSFILILTVQQFETRYFYFPKILGVFVMIMMFSFLVSKKAYPQMNDSPNLYEVLRRNRLKQFLVSQYNTLCEWLVS